jgi:Domain of unknown function (DUF6438)
VAQPLLLKREQVRPVHEILLALNLAFTLVYAIFLYNASELFIGFSTSTGYALFYRFFRSAVRINNSLHLSYSNPSFGNLPNPGSQVGVEITFVLSILCLAILFLLALRLIAGTRLSQWVLNPIAGILILLALPCSYLYEFKITGIWIRDPWPPHFGTILAEPVWGAAEFACIVILFVVYRWGPLSAWAIGFLMILHYLVWFPNLWFGMTLVPFYDLVSPLILLLTFPLSGLAWLLYLKAPLQDPSTPNQVTRVNKWLVASAGVSLALLAAMWLPGRGYSLVRAKHPESLMIEMNRTFCRGSCPVYTIAVHGDGTVEFVGKQYVRDRGPHTETLSKEQLQTLLQSFDRADFFTLEAGAFAWGLDTPRVRVAISIDGKTKEISSDTTFVGAKSGPQALFVQAATALDKIVGSDRWVKCDGACHS